MQNGRAFSIEVFSNYSGGGVYDNTLSSFTALLPEKLDMSNGAWEVALTDVVLPAQIYNIRDGSFFYCPGNISCSGNGAILGPGSVALFGFQVPPGCYQTAQSIVDEMNVDIIGNNPHLKSEQIKVLQTKKGLGFVLPETSSMLFIQCPDLCQILGAKSGRFYDGVNINMMEYPTDIARIHNVLIYCNIVDNVIAGNTKGSLLRSVAFPQKVRIAEDGAEVLEHDKVVFEKSFALPQFRKVVRNQFHSIKFDLVSTSGEALPFVSRGVTALTLLFKQTANHL